VTDRERDIWTTWTITIAGSHIVAGWLKIIYEAALVSPFILNISIISITGTLDCTNPSFKSSADSRTGAL